MLPWEYLETRPPSGDTMWFATDRYLALKAFFMLHILNDNTKPMWDYLRKNLFCKESISDFTYLKYILLLGHQSLVA